MNRTDLSAGDRVARYWDTGAFGSVLQPLTVVRVNQVTATVRTDQGCQFRIPFADINGRVDWED